METIEYDGSSSISSSSSSQTETTERLPTPSSTNHSKRKSGRKKFKETRHPVYRGVRLRNGSNWVCEVREPSKKSRIWLGTFPTPEMAARAYDAATLALHGDDSPLNFADSARLIRRAKSTSASDVQEAALEAALAFGSNHHVDPKPSSSSSACFQMEKGEENLTVDVAHTSFVDEELLFNTPSFYNSMAEGLVITPPGMKKGFDWSDDCASNMDLTLWRY